MKSYFFIMDSMEFLAQLAPFAVNVIFKKMAVQTPRSCNKELIR